jgi:uncharacterized protein involved in exopolysaccharide biosynthesis
MPETGRSASVAWPEHAGVLRGIEGASATMQRDPNAAGGDDESLDLRAIQESLSLIVRAPLRRKKLALALLASAMLLGAWGGRHWKPSYQASGSILVQRSVTLPNFADPSRGTQGNDFDPAVGASDSVRVHENLVSIVQQTHLVSRFVFAPAAPSASPLSDDDKVEILAKLVDARLTVGSDGGVVSFAATWTDPQTAFDVVSAAIHNFLESRQAAEVSIIQDAIALLEDHAQSAREGIDTAMDDFIRLKDGWRTPATPGAALRPRPPVMQGAAPDPDLARRIEEKKLQIKEAEDERRRQLTELKTQMSGLLGTFTPSYPPVMALQKKIDALGEDSPALADLKNAERGLLGELAAKAAARGVPRSPGPMVVLPGTPPGPASKQDLELSDPESAMALSRLENRIHKYEEYMDQISAAKLQLDLARSAFRYRYSIHQPPELPTQPRHSVRTIAGGLSIFLGLLFTFGVTAALDLAGGRFLHPWQVRRKLSLPVLGEVTRPERSSRAGR